jgi:hypothetical protein
LGTARAALAWKRYKAGITKPRSTWVGGSLGFAGWIKMVTDEDRLAFYKLLDEMFVNLQRFPGGFYGALITLTVGVGRIEQKSLDMSSLAASLDIPRATVIRKVERLEKEGILEVTRNANRTLLMSTPRAREIAFPIVDRIIERKRNGAKTL